MVVVILGIMAIFSLPRFGKAYNRSLARSAIANMTMILSANEMFRLRTGANVTASNAGILNNINITLELHIIANGVVYSCNDSGICSATGTGFTVTGTLANPIDSTNPACSGLACP